MVNPPGASTYKAVLDTLVAITSVLVVIAAIYGDRLRHWLAGPKLKLSLASTIGEMTSLVERGTNIPLRENPLIRYFHFKVENERPSAPARSVKVMLLGLYRTGPNGRFVAQPMVSTLQFSYQWVGFPLHDPRPTVGSPVLCDLGCLRQGSDFTLVLYISPTNLNGVVQAGELIRILARAEAENARSNDIVVEIAWDGEWHDGDAEMARHLQVTQLASTDPMS
jgi:hypothetical protein